MMPGKSSAPAAYSYIIIASLESAGRFKHAHEQLAIHHHAHCSFIQRGCMFLAQ